jgi:hypothetical protein
MGILNLGGSGDSEEFDEYYYDDEFVEHLESDDEGAVSAPRSKRLVAMSLAGILVAIGAAFGANIVINSGNGGKIEYGQGFKSTVSCQSDPLTVTPYAGFINDPTNPKFSLDSIYIEGITPTCKNIDFIIKVWDNAANSSSLVVSDSNTSGSNYNTFSSFRFNYVDSATAITSKSNAYIDVENATDTSTGTTDQYGSLQITFDPDTVANFANAQSVYKITVETAVPNANKD